MITYEQRLSADSRWAMSEGSGHFEQKSAVQDTLRRVAERLNALGVEYAVVGGMAMFKHGFRRFTEDVDILLTEDGLRRTHEALEGLGYVALFSGSKHLRDTDTGVRVEFLVAGQFPGDGKPKPVAFPNPADVSVEIDGVRYLGLPSLVELKLASGMTHAGRMKDLGDVQELIRAIKLPRDFSVKLNPFVRGEYERLWDGLADVPTQPM
jgi:hypothetical protein